MAIAASMKMNFSLTSLEALPILETRKPNSGYNDDPVLARFLNDVCIYLHRNSEMKSEPSCDTRNVDSCEMGNSSASEIQNPMTNASSTKKAVSRESGQVPSKTHKASPVCSPHFEMAQEQLGLLEDIMHEYNLALNNGLRLSQPFQKSASQEEMVENVFCQLESLLIEMKEGENAKVNELELAYRKYLAMYKKKERNASTETPCAAARRIPGEPPKMTNSLVNIELNSEKAARDSFATFKSPSNFSLSSIDALIANVQQSHLSKLKDESVRTLTQDMSEVASETKPDLATCTIEKEVGLFL